MDDRSAVLSSWDCNPAVRPVDGHRGSGPPNPDPESSCWECGAAQRVLHAIDRAVSPTERLLGSKDVEETAAAWFGREIAPAPADRQRYRCIEANGFC